MGLLHNFMPVWLTLSVPGGNDYLKAQVNLDYGKYEGVYPYLVTIRQELKLFLGLFLQWCAYLNFMTITLLERVKM